VGRPKTVQQSLPTLKRLLDRFAPELLRQRALVAGSFAAIFAEVFLRLLEPWPLALVLDHVLGLGRDGEALGLGALTALEPMGLLGVAAAALVTVAGLRALCAYASAVGFALAGNRVLTEVRNSLYRRLQELSLAFHTKARSGDLVLRVIGDVGMVKEVVVTAVLPLLANLLILVGILSVMLWMQWTLTLIALCTAPLFWLSTVSLGRRIQAVARKQRRREGNLATQAAETLGGIETMQALSLNGAFAQAFVRDSQGSLREGVQAKRLSARLERSVDVLTALATALVLFFGARIVLRGGLSPGELVVFLAYMKSASRPVRNFAKYTARLAKASAAAERVLEVLESEPDVCNLPGAYDAPPLRGEVRFEGASFRYGAGDPVLSGVDLLVRPGEHIAVVGASGAGKSTLVGALLRLHDPCEGRIRFDGEDIGRFTLASLRRQVSIVLQDTLLFATSVRDNIAFGAAAAEPGEIEAAARLANAHDFVSQLPEGYDTLIGERGLDLSAGQRQRIAIARASISRTPIVILDEPLSGLDEANSRAVTEALDRLTKGRTTFLVTHDLQHAAHCDRILLLKDGRIAEQGTHAELLQRNGAYAAALSEAMPARDFGGPEEARALAR